MTIRITFDIDQELRNLADANLYRANLARANLVDANLARANLYRANLDFFTPGAHLAQAMNKEQIMNTEQERAQPAAATAAPSDETLRLAGVIADKLPADEYMRLLEWSRTGKPASTAFTSGLLRDIAYLLEHVMSEQQEPVRQHRTVTYVCPICAASMIESDEALLRQALEALEFFRDTAICEADTAVATEAIAALRERLGGEKA